MAEVVKSFDWRRVSPDAPCPICGKPDWCLISPDGNAAICPRTPDGAICDLGEAGYLHQLGHDWRCCSVPTRLVAPKSGRSAQRRVAPDELQEHHQRSRRLASCELSELAQRLCLPVDVLDQLEVGYCHEDSCWLLPERDAVGKMIGLQRRFRDNSQRRFTGGQAGLTYVPGGWDTGRGPLLLVEGASDVAAAMALKLSVIGRPSNTGGRPLLAALLAHFPEDRPVIVLGERDQKPDGKWPGKQGAIKTATDLANRLTRPVQWALPPDGAKDLRAWLIRYATQQPDLMGNAFLEGLQPDTVFPPPRQRWQSETRPLVEEQDYRSRMLRWRQVSLDRPGIYLDRSGTGLGKSTADFQVIASLLGKECGS